MSNLNERGSAFEKKFAHDEQTGFKIEARCCKIFGLWVASKLGLSGPEANSYAAEIVGANIQEPGFGDVLKKVREDVTAKGIDITEHTLQAELEKSLAEARKQILAENPVVVSQSSQKTDSLGKLK